MSEERIDLRVPMADLKRWRATAVVEGLSLSEWIRRRCNEAAVDQETIDAVAKKVAERNQMRAERADAMARREKGPVLIIDGGVHPATATAHKVLADEIVEHSTKSQRKSSKKDK